MAKLELGS